MANDIRRKNNNERVLEKMKNGDSLALVSVYSTWYPPRPLTKVPPKCPSKKTKNNNLLAFERKKK